nr:Sus [Ipomoea batatas]
MSFILSKSHWSESDLAEHGVVVTPALVDDALASYWENFAKCLARHKKVYVSFEADQNGSREGALVGFYGNYSGVKNIHFSPKNTQIGLPSRHVDILLRQKVTGQRLMSLEGLAISNGRTGWFALACMNLLLQGAAHRILCVSVLSRHGISNQMLAAKLASKVHFKLDAVKDRTRLHRAGFVITATDAGAPLFEPHEISRNAVTLSLGIDDMPAEYFEMLFSQGGLAVGDDLVAMEARNVDPLSLYYSRRGLKLTEHGRADGVKNYSEILSDATLMERLKNWKGPASFLPVGLASLDVAVAAKIYEMLSITLSTKE